MKSVARTRSNNGYGCDDMETGVAAGEDGQQDVNEWEVKWEDGENDPLNPRSWGNGRKWIIVDC